MKIDVQKDLDISQIRLSHASAFLAETRESRGQSRKKSKEKWQQIKKKQTQQLKQLIKKQKVSKIKLEFMKKLKLLIPHRSIPPQLLALRKQPTNIMDLILLKLTQQQGIKLGAQWHLLWKLIIFLKVIAMLVTTSFMVAFQQQQIHKKFINIVKIFIIVNSIDMIQNFFTQKFQNNHNIKSLLGIWLNYIKNDFILDLPTLILSFIQLFKCHHVIQTILFALTLIKLWRSLHNIEILEHLYITNMFHEKYWSILRVLMFNFIIAHFIAIVTLLMVRGDHENTWLRNKGLQDRQWHQKYIWAYYWAVNIMLTVGFGDICATNHQQALTLIFVQTISCIILAYNINIVGSILTDIKQKQRQRKSQLRILLKMAQQNKIQNNIVEEVIKYVDQSFKIKEKYFYQQHDTIIEGLPLNIQSEYRKQVNKDMIIGSGLASLFSHRSLLKISETITRKIAHPQQIIWKKGQQIRLIILNKGKLGLTYRRGTSTLNGQIIQTIQTHPSSSSSSYPQPYSYFSNKSKLLTINIFKNDTFQYDIKSIGYSVIYHINNEQFLSALCQKNSDYQYYCVLRDKFQYRLEDRELYLCGFCLGQRHDHFSCPKMHYIPLHLHIIHKQLKSPKKYNRPRLAYHRPRHQPYSIKDYKILKTQQQSYLNIISFANSNPTPTPPFLPSNDQISQKTAASIKSNNVFREMEIHRLNSLLVAKMNQQLMYVGFWDLECDTAYNWNTYFRGANPEGYKDCALGNRMKICRMNSLQHQSIFSK